MSICVSSLLIWITIKHLKPSVNTCIRDEYLLHGMDHTIDCQHVSIYDGYPIHSHSVINPT